MKKTVCELFAGVGGFRCGLNNIKTLEDFEKKEKWDTVWFSQWEPAEKKTQYAHDCYVYHFGTRLDKNGQDTTNFNIEDVDKKILPDFNLLVGGFPCQDYSVASSLATSKGLEGKKGVLWWSIRETLEAKQPPFVLVEWRVINAAEYGYQQRRRRVFIFAYKDTTNYAANINKLTGYKLENNQDNEKSIEKVLLSDGFFAETFPVDRADKKEISTKELPEGLGEISEKFSFSFENSGIMKDGKIYTLKTVPFYHGKQNQ